MKRVVRAVVAAALVSAGLGTSAAPASAERWWGRDEAGDVEQLRFVPDPPPCGTLRQAPKPDDATTDLVGLGVRHEGGAIELRAHFRDLTTWGRRGISFEVETAADSFQVNVSSRRRNEPPEAVLYESGEPGPVSECDSYSIVSIGRPCDGLVTTRSFSRDVVTVVLPRTCLDSPRWVQVGASVHRDTGHRTRYDNWGTPQPDAEGHYQGATSPRIRHSR